MRRSAVCAVLLALAPASLPTDAPAESPPGSVDPTVVPCSTVLRLAGAERTRVALWLDGLLKGARWGPTDQRGDTAVGRSLEGVFEACAAEPGRTFADVWVQRYPGGAGAVHPLVLTCGEWTALAPGLRAQVVAWNEGFGAARKAPGAPGFDVAVVRDLAPVASACRSAPDRTLAEALAGRAAAR